MRPTCKSKAALLIKFLFKEEERHGRGICVDHVHVSLPDWWLSVVPGHHTAPCPWTFLRHFFSYNCLCKIAVPHEPWALNWHPCWRLTRFMHVFPFETFREVFESWLCRQSTDLLIKQLVVTTVVHLSLKFAHFISASTGARTFLLFTCVDLSLLVA